MHRSNLSDFYTAALPDVSRNECVLVCIDGFVLLAHSRAIVDYNNKAPNPSQLSSLTGVGEAKVRPCSFLVNPLLGILHTLAC